MAEQSDHDLLIRLSTQMEGNSEVVRSLLGDLGKISAKLDQMREVQLKHDRDVLDIQRSNANMDIRVATLEQQVDTLREDGETARAIANALKEGAKRRDEDVERRIKRMTFIMGGISFLVAMTPYFVTFLRGL